MALTPFFQVAPRVNPYTSWTEALVRAEAATNAEPGVATDQAFPPTDIPNFIGAFDIEGNSTITFSSQALAGPSPGVLPTQWLKRDDAQRVVLVELDYVTQSGTGAAGAPATVTRYLGNWPFFDDENARVYVDCVKSIPRYNRALDRGTLRGRYTSTIGSLELDNADGAFDGLLALACDGSQVRFYIGDATWTRSEFIFVFSAVPTKITAPSWDRISVALKDSGLLLDQTVGGSTTIGGTGPSANQFRPWNFGRVRQVECILQDAATLTYVHTDSAIWTGSYAASVIDVRDKGVSVPFRDNADGTIQLLASPAGTVTADIQTDAGYAGIYASWVPATSGAIRVSDAFRQIAGVECGLVAQGLYAGASGNFELNWTNDYHVGISVTQGTNAVDLLANLCESGNCYWAIRRDGQFTFGWIRPEAVPYIITTAFASAATIADDDIIDGKIKIDHADPTYYEIQGYANQNWMQQSDFATSLTADQLATYQRPGYYGTSYFGEQPTATTYLGPEFAAPGFDASSGYGVWAGGAPQLYHKSMTAQTDVNTLISCGNDTDAAVELADWAAVRRAQFLPWLEFVDVNVDLSYYQLELGNIATLDLTRFALASTMCQVVSIDIGLTEGVIALGLAHRRPAITDTYIA